MAKEKQNRLRSFLTELEWSTTKKYVEWLRSRGELLTIGKVQVDLPQIVGRRFICDAKRCIHWAGKRALVDRGCCCRFEVPVTSDDRRRVIKYLDQVRPNLPEGHRLRDPEASPFQVDDDFGFDLLSDNPLGGCWLNLYIDGQCRCAIHMTALEQGQDPSVWKPLACSMWPLAISDYDDDGETHYLLTIYCDATTDLFDEVDEEPFACIEDQHASYPRMYVSERVVLEHVFGAAWWRKLDSAVKQMLKGRAKAKKKRKGK